MTDKKESPLLWTRDDILFDGTEVTAAKPIREALADRAVRKSQPAVQASQARRQPGDTRDYTVQELAAEWHLSSDKIRELFREEPGVVKLRDENAAKKRKRNYVSLRIPVEVAARVKKRIS